MGGTHHAEPVVLRSLSEHPSGCVSRLHPAMSLFGSDSGPASHRPRKSEPAAGAAGLILSVGANVRFGFPKPFVPCRGAPATAQVQGAHYQSGMELLRCRSAKSFGRRAGYDIYDTVCIDRYLCARSDSWRTLINTCLQHRASDPCLMTAPRDRSIMLKRPSRRGAAYGDRHPPRRAR